MRRASRCVGATGLGVVDRRRRKAANGAVAHQVIDAVVDAEGEGREEDEAAHIEVTESATARHEFMLSE